MRRRWWVLLAVVVLVVAGSAAARALSGPDGPVLEPGEKVTLRSQLYGAVHVVKVPGADIEVSVGAPTRVLDRDLAEVVPQQEDSDDEPVQTDDGDRLVPVSWKTSVTDGGVAKETRATLALRVGGERYPLGRSAGIVAEDAPSVAVAVPGEVTLDDLAVEVTFDGETQVLHPGTGKIDRGPAAPLYGTTRPLDHDECRLGPAPGQGIEADDRLPCTVSELVTFPYLSGLGWASEGSAWVAVRVYVSNAYIYLPGGSVDPTTTQVQVLLDGESPRDGELDLSTDENDEARLVFQVRRGEVPQQLDVRLRVRGETGAGRPTVVRFTERLRLTPRS